MRGVASLPTNNIQHVLGAPGTAVNFYSAFKMASDYGRMIFGGGSALSRTSGASLVLTGTANTDYGANTGGTMQFNLGAGSAANFEFFNTSGLSLASCTQAGAWMFGPPSGLDGVVVIPSTMPKAGSIALSRLVLNPNTYSEGSSSQGLYGLLSSPNGCLNLTGMTAPSSDTGSVPVIQLTARGHSADNFSGATGTARPVLGVYNHNTKLLGIEANGTLITGINACTRAGTNWTGIATNAVAASVTVPSNFSGIMFVRQWQYNNGNNQTSSMFFVAKLGTQAAIFTSLSSTTGIISSCPFTVTSSGATNITITNTHTSLSTGYVEFVLLGGA